MRLGLIVLLGLFALSGCAGTPDPCRCARNLRRACSSRFRRRSPLVRASRLPSLSKRIMAPAGIASRRHRNLVQRFVLAMTVLSGPPLMTVEWHEGAVVVRRGVVPAVLDAERILADFMFVYANEQALLKAVSGGDLVCREAVPAAFSAMASCLSKRVQPDRKPLGRGGAARQFRLRLRAFHQPAIRQARNDRHVHLHRWRFRRQCPRFRTGTVWPMRCSRAINRPRADDRAERRPHTAGGSFARRAGSAARASRRMGKPQQQARLPLSSAASARDRGGPCAFRRGASRRRHRNKHVGHRELGKGLAAPSRRRRLAERFPLSPS